MKGLFLFVLFMIATNSYSQDAKLGVIVELSYGGTAEIGFSENPKISYKGDVVLITSDNYELSYGLSEISKIRIGEVSNDTRINSNEAESFDLEKDNDFVRIRGLTSTDVVNVYNSSGYRITSYKAESYDSVIIPLETMPQGIIIITVRNESIKLLKR